MGEDAGSFLSLKWRKMVSGGNGFSSTGEPSFYLANTTSVPEMVLFFLLEKKTCTSFLLGFSTPTKVQDRRREGKVQISD